MVSNNANVCSLYFFLLYPFGPIGLYKGRALFITLYYYRIIVMLIFTLAWLAINFDERQTILDTILLVLWFLMAFTYSVGLYVHQRTYAFFKTRWIGYDDGDLIFAAKLRAQGLPVAAYNMQEYFASINLDYKSATQCNGKTTSNKKD
ncbi:hypothetical protein DINM_004710 [Dirofilaria immitis]|nr:hypothetical protein [Dirofilaria immitis]